jgi:hypothetical protein
VVVECRTPWVPILENGGHECLIAEAYIPVFDPLTSPMDPVDDRHVGQKNEQLIVLGAGQSFSTQLKALNVLGVPQALTFEVQPLRLTAIPPLLAARARRLPAQLQPPSAVLPLSLKVSDAAALYTGPSMLFASRLLSRTRQEVAGTAIEAVAPVQITHSATFEPWESRVLEIGGQIPGGAKVGQSFMFRVVQRVGRMVTGGYTIHVVVADR